MCQYKYIRHVFRLSAACSFTQQVWRDNASTIVCTVFRFLRSELFQAIQLAQLKTSALGEAVSPDLIIPQDLNSAVCLHIQSLARIYYGARAFLLVANFRSEKLNHYVGYGDLLHLRYCTKMFLLFYRFVVGYEHPSILPAAYMTLHSLSTTDISLHTRFAQKFEGKWLLYGEGLGIERPREEEGLQPVSWMSQDPMPRAWSFAIEAFSCESRWRPENYPGPQKEHSVRRDYHRLCERYGTERVKMMFGGDGPPWAEERAKARLEKKR
jgi:hypothetical protein